MRESELRQLKEKLDQSQAELVTLSRPFTEDMASSVVRAGLNDDGVLVMGGYEVDDGKRQFTFLSPKLEKSDDELEMIVKERKGIKSKTKEP